MEKQTCLLLESQGQVLVLWYSLSKPLAQSTVSPGCLVENQQTTRAAKRVHSSLAERKKRQELARMLWQFHARQEDRLRLSQVGGWIPFACASDSHSHLLPLLRWTWARHCSSQTLVYPADLRRPKSHRSKKLKPLRRGYVQPGDSAGTG